MKPTRTRRLWLAALLAIGVPSLALAFATAPSARERVVSLLRSIETLPTPARLDEVAGDNKGAGQVLRDVASDDQVNLHARLSATSRLAEYPGEPSERQLTALIEHGLTVRAGAPTLQARAAALSLASIAGRRAVPSIAPLLDHVVPDVRADAARALGSTRSLDADPILRKRLQIETSELVRVELIEAIRAVTP